MHKGFHELDNFIFRYLGPLNVDEYVSPVQGPFCRIVKQFSALHQKPNSSQLWHFCEAGSFSYGESQRTSPLEGTSLHRRNKSVERPWGTLSLFTVCHDYRLLHPARGCDTDMWRHLCEAGLFSYGESPRTPPRTGTSLQRRIKSVERPWGILSLFTTCVHVQENSPSKRCYSNLWRLWKAGRFPHGEVPPTTQPRDGTSPH